MKIKYMVSLLIAGSLTASAMAMYSDDVSEIKTVTRGLSDEATVRTAQPMATSTDSTAIIKRAANNNALNAMPASSTERQQQEERAAMRQAEEPFAY